MLGSAIAQDRPQLAPAQAAAFSREAWLGDWVPEPDGDRSRWPADAVVKPGQSLQAVLAALPPANAKRRYVRVEPGEYRGAVCVRGLGPITIYGVGAPEAVKLVDGRYAAQAKRADEPAQPCIPAIGATTVGTAGSSSVVIAQDDVRLTGLTIANDALDGVRTGVGYPPGAGESGGAQAVALMTRGDRIQLDAVALLGHQDTFYADGPGRVHVANSRIAGDVDFIFGAARLLIEHSLIVSRAGRRSPGEGGIGLAPSTPPGQAHGFLITQSRWIVEVGTPSLGRAWDAGVKKPEAGGQWITGQSPNGQALIRDSLLDARLAPWVASTARRPFDAKTNRLAEFNNLRLPAAAFETAPTGWATQDGGTSGGANAAPEAIRLIRDRAQLEAALRELGKQPKVLAIAARIELGGPADAFRDPAYDQTAYETAYDPKTWGRRKPEGPLEQARERSSAAQGKAITLRIPSNTTLIGVTPDAGFHGGMLLLSQVENVILRNLRFSDAYDHFTAWDPLDGEAGEWNADYDTVSLRGARRVWVDHCSFDDGERPDHLERTVFGRQQQRHDGLLDITHGADLVTISWNRFSGHDKTMLIGGSDKHVGDAGKLRVTLHHNLWVDIKERAPRVRFGQVHVVNNLYLAQPDGPYGFAYAIGLGLESAVLSQANAFEGPVQPTQLLRWLKGERFSDQDSTLNGQPLHLSAPQPAGWTPPYRLPPEPAATAAARVRAAAGPTIGAEPERHP
jgi:pectate lyase/pectin methylesterase-like acyl-CoA thioesterase